MSSVADRPEDDNNDEPQNNDKELLKSYSTSSKTNELPIEKQFTHMMFCNQIQNISLAEAKRLLEELHLLYLGQSYLFAKITKQEFLGGL